jgi:hypothetical protein
MGLDFYPLDIKKVNILLIKKNYLDINIEKKYQILDMFDKRFCKYITKDGTICGRKSRILVSDNCCRQHLKFVNKEKCIKSKYYIKKEIMYKCKWVNKYGLPCKRNVKYNNEACIFHKKVSYSNEFENKIIINSNPLEKNNKMIIIPKEKKKKKYIEPKVLEEYRNYDCIKFLECLKFNIIKLSYNYTKAKNDIFNFTIKNNYYYDNNTCKNDKGVLNLIMYIYKIDMHKAVKFIKNNKNKYVFSFFSFGNNNKIFSNEFKKYNIKKQNPLELPEIVEKNIEKVKEYLICKRYINRNIVNSLIKEKRIYSDKYSNCIFTNESYTFCSIRGTSTNKYVSCRGVPDYIIYKRNIKMDLYLFESPIDTLSYMTLNPDKDGVFISTNGSMMINNFKKYEIQTYNNLYLCLDNDKQGNIYYNNIMQAFKNYKINIIRIKSNYKDFNEDLINLIDFKK